MGKHKHEDEDEGPEMPLVDQNIFKLAATSNIDLLKELVEREQDPVDVNSIDSLGATPLLWSVRVGNTDIMKYLIDKGADIEHKGSSYKYHPCNNFTAIKLR